MKTKKVRMTDITKSSKVYFNGEELLLTEWAYSGGDSAFESIGAEFCSGSTTIKIESHPEDLIEVIDEN